MRNALSMIFFVSGGLAVAAAGLYGVYLSFSIVFSVFPAWFAYLSLMFFPFVYGIAPLYSGFALGDWTLFLVSYLGIVPGAIMIWLGTIIKGEE
jgi:hypothetical protein|tara:strand:- start:33 stop:314 length:282 start_codon:yes stop_codon:yes gene_type:complete